MTERAHCLSWSTLRQFPCRSCSRRSPAPATLWSPSCGCSPTRASKKQSGNKRPTGSANTQEYSATKGVTLFALVDHSGETEKVGMKMRSTKLLIFGSPKAPSIQRLGGLKLPSSRGALHAVIEMAMILSRNGLCMRRFALEMFLSYLESSSCLPWAIGNYLNRPSLTTAFRFRSPCCSRSDCDSPECSWRADPRMRINCVGRRIERHRPDFGRSPVGRWSTRQLSRFRRPQEHHS